MSSVSGSGGSNRNDEIVRRNREDYQNKESELVKRHNREIRRLSEAHMAELRRLEETHKAQLDNLKAKSRESMTLRDRKYQKEMENLKQVHRQQLANVTAETEEKMRRHREALENELRLAQASNDHRVKDINYKYQNLIDEQRNTFTQRLDEVKEDQKEAILRARENLQRAHKKQMEALEQDRQGKVSELQSNYNELKNTSSRRLKTQEIQHMNDRTRMTENFFDERERMERAHQENQEILRKGFQDGLRKQRDEFEKAQERNRSAQYESVDNLKATVNERLDNQIRRLERKIADLKEAKVRDQVENQRKARLQIENIERDYQKKLSDMEEQKKHALDQFNDHSARDIAKIRKETNDVLRHKDKFYRSQIQMQDLKSKEALESIKTDLIARNEQQKMNTEARVEHLLDHKAKAEERLRENFNATLDAVRDESQAEKLSLRGELEKQKNEAIQRVKDQMAKNEISNQRRLAETISRYEKRLAELNDRTMKEKRLTAIQQKRSYEALKKAHQAEIDATRVQYEEKLAQINREHQKEIETLKRRNNEQINEIVQTMRKT